MGGELTERPLADWYARPFSWPNGDLVDCDVHLTVPSIEILLPFLPDRWADYVVESGARTPGPDQYPPSAPLSALPGSRPESGSPAGSDLGLLQSQLLDPWQVTYAVACPGYPVDAIHNDDWAAAMATAVNDWQLAVWLRQEPRLRGSVVVAPGNAELAAAEIDRVGNTREFVQVLLPVRCVEPLGRRRFWPIYEAASRYGLVVGVYAGGVSGSPVSAVGWPTYYLEDYVDLAQAFQSQVLSLVSEGVFRRFPDLRVAFIEGGFTWLPPLMWRFDKVWKGVRREIPWVDRPPSEIIRDHIRFTTQPMDEPVDSHQLLEVIDQLESEEILLFSTDYPHWQFDDADDALPAGLPKALQRRILGENALRWYPFERRCEP